MHQSTHYQINAAMPALTRNGIRPVLSAVFMAVWGIYKMFLKGFHRPALVFWGVLLVCGNTCLVGQVPRLVVPIGHTKEVSSVDFSPDGKTVLTGSADNTAKLWDLSGRLIQTFKGHTDQVHSVAFSPDGKTVLTGSFDKTASLWDLSGRLIQTFKGHKSFIESVAFRPDGKQILTGSSDKTAKLWDLTGRVIQTFKGHAEGVCSVAFSPDGKQVLTGSYDYTAKLWDLSGLELQTFKGHKFFISSVDFSPDGKTVLTGSRDKTAKLWDLSGQEMQTFIGHSEVVWSVTFSPDGKTVLTASSDNTAKLWDLTGRVIQTFTRHAYRVTSVAFSPDGKTILTGSEDKTAVLWDLMGHETQSLKGYATAVSSVTFSPDGKTVLTGNWDNTVKFWDLSGRTMQTFNGTGGLFRSVVFSPDGNTVLIDNSMNTTKLWDLSGRELKTFTGNAVSFSPDGKTVLTNCGIEIAKLWDLSGRELKTFTGKAVAFSPDGRAVLTKTGINTLKLRDLSDREIQTFKGHKVWGDLAVFSHDGKTVLMNSWDNTAKLWNLSGRVIQTFRGHAGHINALSFSPDDKQVLIGYENKTAKLWDLKGHLINTFTGHEDDVTSLAFAPNSKQVLTGSLDNTSKLWSAVTGRELATLVAIDSTDWVVTTPSGLFDASPDAMKLMHYVVGLEVIELEQLKERYYEPGLLAKIMGFDKGELRDVAAFTEVALYPEINANIEKDRLAIQLTERNGGLGKLSLFINGKEVQEDINPKRQKSLNIDLNTFAKYYQPGAGNKIALRAYNAEGWLKSQAYELEYQPAKVVATPLGGTKTIPRLYALVVGTSDYAGDRLDLRFADSDAEAMAKALKSAGSALFGAEGTMVRLLSTSAKTPADVSSKTNIAKAFDDVAAKAQPADVLVVYFSGHGQAYGDAEKAQFYYLTKDIGSEDLSDPVVRDNYTISSNEFTQWLTAIPAQKQVMILDACNSGKVVESLAAIAQKNLDPSQIRALDRMKDRTGMFILTGSAADKVSYEASQYGQGLLTYSLLQGMSGLALTDDKRVDVMTLFQYSRDKVPELAKGIGGIQTPVLAFPAGGASFDIGIVTPQVKIPLAQVKPVFIRNNFTNEVSFADDLKLTKALENYFREITARGAEADLIFVDVSEYENAYSIKGRYTVSGEAVQVRGRLFKGETTIGSEFQVTGKKNDLQGLVEGIVDKVSVMIK